MEGRRKSWLFFVVFVLGCIVGVQPIWAQAFPTKNVQLIINYPPGGTTDVVARLLADKASNFFSHKVVCENRPGGGGILGASYMLNQPPDGYTIGTFAFSNLGIIPHMRAIPYDPLKDVAHILSYAEYPFGLIVKNDAPWKTFEDFIKYAKANPDKLKYSTTGVGAPSHLGIEQLAMVENIKWRNVPYKGGVEAVVAVMGGMVDFHAPTPSEALPHLKAGKVRFLLSMSSKRWKDFSNVPTILEKGYDFTLFSYMSIGGPKKIPEAVRNKLEEGFKKAWEDPGFVEALDKFGLVAAYMSGAEYEKFVAKNSALMEKVIKHLGLVEKK